MKSNKAFYWMIIIIVLNLFYYLSGRCYAAALPTRGCGVEASLTARGCGVGAARPSGPQDPAKFCGRVITAPYSFSVQKEGHGPALILIPGAYCSGDVWKETVAQFKDRYTCYSLTLPGFAGQPAIGLDNYLSTVAAEIAAFIQKEGLGHPVIMGHSLGGFLALRIAVDNPGLPSQIVCVSSAPFLPGLSMGNDVTVDSTRKIGVYIKKFMASATPEQTLQTQKSILKTMIRDTTRIPEVSEWAGKSDPATQGEAMAELFGTDLRADMGKVTCPILVIGDYIAYKNYGATRESVTKNYQIQFAKARQVRIVLSDAAYHFIMFDDPQWFYQQVASIGK
jgi:N-formylmaleamate deformylase